MTAIARPVSSPQTPFAKSDFLRLLWCRPFLWMLLFLVVEAALAATSTALIIQAGRDFAEEEFLISDFAWIVAAQSASYAVGAASWVFAERAGFGAFARYMMRFASDNRLHTSLLADKQQREKIEPFLTNETFHILFELVYQLEGDLKLFLGLVFNAIVLGAALDAGLPVIYAVVFVVLFLLQWSLRKPVSKAYLTQQQNTNRMTAHTYTAWDNIFSGNRYNFRLWHAGFKQRVRGALDATIRAILAREGLAAVGGIFALLCVFTYLAWVAFANQADTALLIGLAATLPRQIEMTSDVRSLASGWNDLWAIWTRIGGASEAMRPEIDDEFHERIDFAGLELLRDGKVLAVRSPEEALGHVLTPVNPSADGVATGRILVRGRNGAGKSTLLAELKARLGVQAFYWPTTDRLSFEFSRAALDAAQDAAADDAAEEGDDLDDVPVVAVGFSSGERQLRSLQEIVAETEAKVYLLDEWDANLDSANRAAAEAQVEKLAARAVVVEISHRDRR